jgi:PAS domain-containing protein
VAPPSPPPPPLPLGDVDGCAYYCQQPPGAAGAAGICSGSGGADGCDVPARGGCPFLAAAGGGGGGGLLRYGSGAVLPPGHPPLPQHAGAPLSPLSLPAPQQREAFSKATQRLSQHSAAAAADATAVDPSGDAEPLHPPPPLSAAGSPALMSDPAGGATTVASTARPPEAVTHAAAADDNAAGGIGGGRRRTVTSPSPHSTGGSSHIVWSPSRTTLTSGGGLGDEGLLHMVVEASPAGMVAVDAEGTIVMANATACGMFGYTRSQLRGEKVELLIPERFRAAHPGYRHE